MALDRLEEVEKWILAVLDNEENEDCPPTKNPRSDSCIIKKEDGEDIEQGHPRKKKPCDGKRAMESFSHNINKLNTDMKQLKTATEEVRQNHREMLRTTTTAGEQYITSRLNTLLAETNRTARQMKNLLETLKQETALLEENTTMLDESEIRLRKNLVCSFTRMYIGEMKAYQNAQQEYKLAIKTKAKRQIQMVKPDVSDEEVDNIMRNEGGRDQFYRAQIFSHQVKEQYAIAAEKYQDILKIEESLLELHRMFLDVATLAGEQGEVVAVAVEKAVVKAADTLEDANGEQDQALKFQKKLRKKHRFLILAVAVVCTIVVFVFLFG